MKIWKSFSGEHSANLRIVGTFKTSEDAKNSAALFNRLLAVENKYPEGEEKAKGMSYSRDMMKFLEENNFIINPQDIEYLEYYGSVTAQGNTVEYTMDDFAIQPLIQAMIYYGARVEVFSRHDYNS